MHADPSQKMSNAPAGHTPTPPDLPTEDVVKREMAIEQEHVDRVHAQLEVDEAKAHRMARASNEIYHSDRTTWVR